MPCLLAWAALGAGARHILREARAIRRFNIVMGVLLALSVLPLLR
jgi:threonine/homoserine/homoserine lactone efflux protein